MSYMLSLQNMNLSIDIFYDNQKKTIVIVSLISAIAAVAIVESKMSLHVTLERALGLNYTAQAGSTMLFYSVAY